MQSTFIFNLSPFLPKPPSTVKRIPILHTITDLILRLEVESKAAAGREYRKRQRHCLTGVRHHVTFPGVICKAFYCSLVTWVNLLTLEHKIFHGLAFRVQFGFVNWENEKACDFCHYGIVHCALHQCVICMKYRPRTRPFPILKPKPQEALAAAGQRRTHYTHSCSDTCPGHTLTPSRLWLLPLVSQGQSE